MYLHRATIIMWDDYIFAGKWQYYSTSLQVYMARISHWRRYTSHWKALHVQLLITGLYQWIVGKLDTSQRTADVWLAVQI